MDETQRTSSENQGIDRLLFITVILLLGFGVVMVYSASGVRAATEQGDAKFFLIRQAIFASLGVVAMLVGSCIDYYAYRKLVYPALGLSILGLLLVHTPLGVTVNGAARWIGLGPIRIQPSETVKLTLILWLSYSLAKKGEKIKTFSIGLLPHLLVPGAIIVLCLAEPDFGTSVVLAVTTFTLLFIAGAKLAYMMLAALASAPLVYYLIAGSEYRLNRILTFLDPISQRFDQGYQLSQSLYGFSAGGFFGVGIGDGLQKFFFLPEAHNDFIASIIAEELGVVGIWLLLVGFGIVLVRGFLISLRARTEFGTYVGMGITMLITVQSLANLGVAMGLLPTKGLNLPFVSYGGSALVISLFSIGILLNISRRRPVEESMVANGSPQNRLRPKISEKEVAHEAG